VVVETERGFAIDFAETAHRRSQMETGQNER